MKQKKASRIRQTPTDGENELRGRAESILADNTTGPAVDYTEELSKLVHDLQVHQIELELQNDELKKAHLEADEAHAKYFDLYDLAPVAYLTLDKKASILEINFTGCRFLGENRSKLINRRLQLFIETNDIPVLNAYIEKLFSTGQSATCEISLSKKGKPSVRVQLEGSLSTFAKPPVPHCRVIMVDISELRKAEHQFKALFETMTEGVLICRLLYDDQELLYDYTIVNANNAIEKHIGTAPQNAIGKPASGFFGTTPPPYLKEISNVIQTGKSLRFEEFFTPLGRHFSVSLFTTEPGIIAIIIEDISERIEAETEIRNTLSATTDGIWKRNTMTGEVYFSPSYYTMLGYEPDEFPASLESWKSLIHPDDYDHAMKVHSEFEQGDYDLYLNEFRMRGKHGGYRIIRSRGKVVKRNDQGQRLQIIGNHEDITDERASEIAIEETNQLLTAIIDNTDLMIAYLDVNCGFIRVNRAYAGYYQKDPSFLTGKNLLEFFPEEDVMEGYQYVINTGKKYYKKTPTIINTPPDFIGKNYWEWSLIPIMNQNESIRGVVLTLIDVSNHIHTEHNLSRFNERLEQMVTMRTEELSIVNENLVTVINQRIRLEEEKDKAYKDLDIIIQSMAIGMIVIDTDFSIVRANRRFLEMLSLNTDEVIGKKCHDVWKCEHQETNICPKNAIQTDDEYKYESTYIDRNGNELIFMISSTRYYLKSGEVAGMIQNVIDITEKRSIQRKFISIIDEERQNISHELHDGLGQDLTAIGFLLEAMRQGLGQGLGQGLDEYEKVLFRKIDELSLIIQQAQGRTRSISRLLSPVNLEQHGFESAINELAEHFEEIYKIRCIVTIAGEIEPMESDVSSNMYFIIREAINNAVKHSMPETVFINLASEPAGLSITVSDDGSGAFGEPSSNGMGIKIMKHRADISRSLFHITHSETGGFIIHLFLPKT